MKKTTKKHSRIVSKYMRQRRLYLSNPANQLCKIDVAGCSRIATEIHHTAKKQTEQDWLDESKWVPCCHNCHTKIEESPDLARELGIYNYNK